MATGNETQITPPRVPLTDERTGAVSREWYRWFYSLFTTLGSGTGIVPVDAGGTGLGTIPTNGQLLIGNGTGYTLNTLGYGAGISVTNGAGTIIVANTGVLSWSGGTTGLTPATATTGAVTLAGTLVIANGGTNGAATPTAGAVAYGTGTAYGFTAAGTSGYFLKSQGAGIPIWSNSIGGYIVDGTTPYLDWGNGSAVTLAAGRMWYDGSTGAWNLGMGNGNITQQIGEELFVYGKASAAITDSPLQIIYHTGVVGASGVITFAPTVAGITDVNSIIGIATENLALNGFGRVTSFGVVRGITTNGAAFGETWADDDVIWYNPVTGNPTKTEPVAPYIKVQVGLVIKAGAGGSGSFQVGVVRGSKLGGTDSNVQFGTLANNDLIAYDTALGYWKNIPSTTFGTGTVTSVGLSLPSIMAVSGSPVTTSGTLTGTLTTQAINRIFAGPSSGAAAAPTFRALVTADIPSLSYVSSVSGTAGRITSTGGLTPILDLASGIATAGTTGSATLVPVITIDTYGRVTSITTAANPQGTVTSVAQTFTGGLISVAGSPITSSGTLALTIAGTSTGIPYFSSASTWTSSSALTFDGTNFATTGTATAAKLIPTGTSVTGNGMYLPATNAIGISTNGTNAVYIDASQNVLVGTTTTRDAKIVSAGASGAYSYRSDAALTAGSYYHFTFNPAGGAQAGFIYSPTAATTAYVTTSDYRLKENVQPMTGALAKVALLKPVTYKWKIDGIDGQGFIAHELQAVVPDCVAGEKDAIDANGNPKYQGIDTSFLVATLTAAIQEQQAFITSLTARIEALETK